MIVFNSTIRTIQINDDHENQMDKKQFNPLSKFSFGRLVSTFADGSPVIGTATFLKTKSVSGRGLYALTSAQNLFDKSRGGRAKSVLFQKINEENGNLFFDDVHATDWYYPQQYTEHCIPSDIDRRLIRPHLLKPNDHCNYGLIKLSEKIELDSYPEIISCTEETINGQSINVSGLFGNNPVQNNYREVTGFVTKVSTTELGYKIEQNDFIKDRAEGSVITIDKNYIVAIHIRCGWFGHECCYGLRFVPTIIQELNNWQY